MQVEGEEHRWHQSTEICSGEFQVQVVLEAFQSEKAGAEIARAYDVHPVTVFRWKQETGENGPEVFGGEEEVQEYEERISQLEQVLGKREVEIALLKNILDES